MENKERSVHGAEVTALIFAGLGWVTFGILAIPAVIIAHCLTASGAATSIVTKITFRVAYTAIAIASAIVLKAGLSMYKVSSEIAAFRESHQGVGALYSNQVAEPLYATSDSRLTLWLSLAGITLALLLIIPPVMNWMRRSQMKAQSDRIMRMNRNR
jgi:hypothetical protein